MSNYSSSEADLARRDAARSRQLTIAGVLFLLAGGVHVTQGVVALVDETFFTASAQALYDFNVTTWGWVQLFGGVVMLATGLAVLRRALWVRPIAIVVACISMFTTFIWFPGHLLGSMVIIGLTGIVIGALTTPGAFERDD